MAKNVKKAHKYKIVMEQPARYFEVVGPNGLAVLAAPTRYSTTRACRRAALKISENLGIPIKE